MLTVGVELREEDDLKAEGPEEEEAARAVVVDDDDALGEGEVTLGVMWIKGLRAP